MVMVKKIKSNRITLNTAQFFRSSSWNSQQTPSNRKQKNKTKQKTQWNYISFHLFPQWGRKESTCDILKLVDGCPLNGCQACGQPFPDDLDVVLTGWISVNLLVLVTCEPEFSQSWNNCKHFTWNFALNLTFLVIIMAASSQYLKVFLTKSRLLWNTSRCLQNWNFWSDQQNPWVSCCDQGSKKTWNQAFQAFLCWHDLHQSQRRHLKPWGSSGLPHSWWKVMRPSGLRNNWNHLCQLQRRQHSIIPKHA